MLAISSNNRQSPKFTPRQYFILYGIIFYNMYTIHNMHEIRISFNFFRKYRTCEYVYVCVYVNNVKHTYASV